MYKVLIVDDEYLIRNDLVNMIHWESLPLTLTDTAEDGLDALDKIEKEKPDIIITDIRMPEVDGIELIKRVRDLHPEIKFILISGYSEFNYAQSAMKYGVKHYLLKPSTDKQLETVLLHTIEELDETIMSKQTSEQIAQKYSTIKEDATEHYFKMYLTGDSYGQNAWNYFSKKVDSTIISKEGTLVVFKLCSIHELIHVFALQNITREVLLQDHIIIDSKFDSFYSFIVNQDFSTFLEKKLEQVISIFNDLYQLPTICVYKSFVDMKDLPLLYHEIESTILTNYYFLQNKVNHSDLIFNDLNKPFQFEYLSLRLGFDTARIDLTTQELTNYLSQLFSHCFSIKKVNKHLNDLYTIMLSYSNKKTQDTYLSIFNAALQEESNDAIRIALISIATFICNENDSFLKENYSSVVNQMIHLIHNQYNKDDFTLKHIAKNILFLNKDYLSKQFKKETDIGFSEYLCHYRMETAKSLIKYNKYITTSEIASKVGYGINASYFSKAFKKFTGLTPKDYS